MQLQNSANATTEASIEKKQEIELQKVNEERTKVAQELQRTTLEVENLKQIDKQSKLKIDEMQ